MLVIIEFDFLIYVVFFILLELRWFVGRCFFIRLCFLMVFIKLFLCIVLVFFIFFKKVNIDVIFWLILVVVVLVCMVLKFLIMYFIMNWMVGFVGFMWYSWNRLWWDYLFCCLYLVIVMVRFCGFFLVYYFWMVFWWVWFYFVFCGLFSVL